MNKKEKNEPTKKPNIDERLEKIRSLITHQSEDAAKVFKMWLDKTAEKNK
jgi:flagellar biosynthesis/type III secretory pathway M-ring protein FliF/YscJ